MTSYIDITPDQIRALDWQYADAECVDWDVRAAVIDHDPELGDGVVEPAIASAGGYVTYTASLHGRTIQLDLNWRAGGNTDGSYADLYDWDVELDEYLPYELRQPVRALDEDGAPDDDLLREALRDIADSLDWAPHALATLPSCPAPEDIDTTTETTMDTITLTRDDARDVRFSGEEIASVSSRDPVSGPRNTRWTELTLYRTASGRLVCSEVGRTQWQGEHDRHRVYIADDGADLVGELGTGWLAKELYDEAGIECIEDVE